MQIITSHSNTDFDGFASMLGARKLYPDAHILFSGPKERALATFLDNPYYEFEEVHLKDIDLKSISDLIMVDVSDITRLGPLEKIINLDNIEITVIDHHTSDAGDSLSKLKTKQTIIEAVGATTTIIVEMLRARKIPISKIEATIFALGIYEDTGFLTFPSTTPRDVMQVAYLLECGADLSIVSKFLRNELSQNQIALLNELITSARTHEINGTKIVVSTASRDDFVHDAAAVIHKQVEVERYPVYIAAIRMGDKIHIIGRSRHQRVNLGVVFKRFGGGGHPPAAYAMISGKTLVEVTEMILQMLKEIIPPAISAKDIMTKNLITLPPETSLNKAHNLMVKANVNSIPVKNHNNIVGVITRQQLGKALSLGLKSQIMDVMVPEFTLIDPESSIEEAEQRIMEGTERSVLVGKNAASVSGIITRMDLFRRLYTEKKDYDPSMTAEFLHKRYRHFNAVEMIGKRLPPRILTLLKKASQVAEKRSEQVFLVGGIVRDLVLDYENKDVDLVVIGDGIGFAEELSKKCKGYTHAHHQFGTAVVVLPNDFRIDVVTARRESYAYPGALPDVETGSLRADLYRRDFTINTLAIDLSEKHFGRVIDYFGGMRDVQNRTIRILHGLSFIDDPTRMLRAMRFATRFNFQLSVGTQQMLNSAVEKNMLWRVGGKRIQAELKQLLEDPRPVAAIILLNLNGLLKTIHRKTKIDRFTLELLQHLDDTISWFKITFPHEKVRCYLLFFMVLFEKLTRNERLSLSNKMHLHTKDKSILLDYKKQVKRAVFLYRRKKDPSPSRITALFDDFSLETILYTHAFANMEQLKEAVATYLTKYRHIQTEIKGKDLLNLGMDSGPQLGNVLLKIRNCKLDGVIDSRNEELKLAKKCMTSIERKSKKKSNTQKKSLAK